MRGTAMPKTTVQEDGHARLRKGDIRPNRTTPGDDYRKVHAEAQPVTMQHRPKPKLRTRISVSVSRHDPPSHGGYVGPWIPCLGWLVGHVNSLSPTP